MSTSIAKISGSEFDSMVDCGAFNVFGPRKIELIRGELRIMNPAGPLHDDFIQYLTRWSTDHTTASECSIRVQCGFVCDESRPEPDILWLRPKRYRDVRPTAADVMLLIEVSDSSVTSDLHEKADLYAENGIQEYWVVDVPARRIHVMKKSDGQHYRDVEVIVPPKTLSPTCHPTASLLTAELFDVD